MPPPDPGCPGCAARDEEIALLRDQAEVQRARIGELEEKVARLERLLSRNSGNSSMPPSADDLPGKKQPQDRKRAKQGKRRPGKQPGAPGAYLAWTDRPDDTIDRFPEGECACGADEAGAEDLGVTALRTKSPRPGAAWTGSPRSGRREPGPFGHIRSARFWLLAARLAGARNQRPFDSRLAPLPGSRSS